MENNEILNKLAQANALLQNVHVHGKNDLGAMLTAMGNVEAVMMALVNGEAPDEEENDGSAAINAH